MFAAIYNDPAVALFLPQMPGHRERPKGSFTDVFYPWDKERLGLPLHCQHAESESRHHRNDIHGWRRPLRGVASY